MSKIKTLKIEHYRGFFEKQTINFGDVPDN